MPRVYSGVHGQRNYNEDFSLQKNTYFTERIFLEFRAEAFNAFNRHIFNTPDSNPNDANFGNLTNVGTINDSRKLQLNLKLHY